jgi:hypothetical protein
MNNISSSEIQSGFLARLHESIQTKTKKWLCNNHEAAIQSHKANIIDLFDAQNLQCIDRGQPWNQKALELVRGSPSTAFDFRSGLIWMWWFLRRFAARKRESEGIEKLSKTHKPKPDGDRSITYENLEDIVGRFAQCIDAVDLDDLVAGMN